MRRKAKQASFGFTSWGGKRAGAGRKPKGERAFVSHRTRPKLKHYTPALVTLRLCANLPSLRDDGVLAVVKDARQKSAREDFRIVHFSIQTNHLHLIVEAKDNAALSRGMQSFTVRLAKLLDREWRRKGRVFGDRYHLQVLSTPQQVRNALVYTLNDARKHNSWKPKRPDPYSSGLDFAHWLEPSTEWDRDHSAQSRSTPPKRPKRRPGMSSIEWFELASGYTKENQWRVRERRPSVAAKASALRPPPPLTARAPSRAGAEILGPTPFAPPESRRGREPSAVESTGKWLASEYAKLAEEPLVPHASLTIPAQSRSPDDLFGLETRSTVLWLHTGAPPALCSVSSRTGEILAEGIALEELERRFPEFADFERLGESDLLDD